MCEYLEIGTKLTVREYLEKHYTDLYDAVLEGKNVFRDATINELRGKYINYAGSIQEMEVGSDDDGEGHCYILTETYFSIDIDGGEI